MFINAILLVLDSICGELFRIYEEIILHSCVHPEIYPLLEVMKCCYMCGDNQGPFTSNCFYETSCQCSVAHATNSRAPKQGSASISCRFNGMPKPLFV